MNTPSETAGPDAGTSSEKRSTGMGWKEALIEVAEHELLKLLSRALKVVIIYLIIEPLEPFFPPFVLRGTHK